MQREKKEEMLMPRFMAADKTTCGSSLYCPDVWSPQIQHSVALCHGLSQTCLGASRDVSFESLSGNLLILLHSAQSICRAVWKDRQQRAFHSPKLPALWPVQHLCGTRLEGFLYQGNMASSDRSFPRAKAIHCVYTAQAINTALGRNWNLCSKVGC